jgi:hypothetical protein
MKQDKANFVKICIMENTYLKTDDNKLINEIHITWVKKMKDCLHVCTKTTGCVMTIDTHKICKVNTPQSYEKLNIYFETKER